ncbi:MAG: zinc ribbon domain-containing protein [Verrucomicrobiales bacterium]|nr:C4-type zinc ribbon domain-containing protein [Verrucomicrobiota bacterium JB025]
MLDEVRALLILQDRDRRILDLENDLDRLPLDEARATAKLAADEAAVKSAHAAIIDCDIRLKKIELDVQTRKTTIQRLKTQQFETRKNEEYQALAQEIVRYEKQVDELETAELELMEEMDALREKESQAKAALAKTSKFVDEDIAAIKQRHQQNQNALDELRAERSNLTANIPTDVIQLYERLMKTKDGVAVAPLDANKCGGCHMKLIPSTIVGAQNANEITRCEDCGRILYQPE